MSSISINWLIPNFKIKIKYSLIVFGSFSFLSLFILMLISNNTFKNELESVEESLYSRTISTLPISQVSLSDDTTSSLKCSASSCWDYLLETDKLSGIQFIEYLLWTNQSSCRLTYEFGGIMKNNPPGYDGQKTVCMDQKVRPNSSQCLVYSFGIDYEWSFDEEMELYGCQVFSFDPSMNMKPHNHSPAIYFYDWGLSHLNGKGGGDQIGWNMRTFSAIYNDLSRYHGNHTIVDYLKIDIESAEWQVIEEIIKSGMLSKVRQLGVEFHLYNNFTIIEYRKQARLLRLLEKSGMVRFDSKYNLWYTDEFPKLKLRASRGYEIAWYNSKLQHHLDIIDNKYVDFVKV